MFITSSVRLFSEMLQGCIYRLGKKIMYKVIIRLFVFFISLNVVSGTAQQSEDYIVSRDHILCVIDNVQVYLELDEPVVFISLPLCPEIPENLTLMSTIYNADPEYVESQLDTFIFLTKAQLLCLSDLPIPQSGNAVVYSPETCSLRSRDDE